MLNNEFIHPYRLILGSASPRRAKILQEAGLHFEVRVVPTDEVFSATLACKDVAVSIALKKAEVQLPRLKADEILITADTIVVYQDKVLGKPADEVEALATIQKLSGQKHAVYTGVAITTLEKQKTFTDYSEIEFEDISREEMLYYIHNFHPYDKAGSYGIQEWIGATKVKKINGSYLNIMGLPMAMLYQELLTFRSSL